MKISTALFLLGSLAFFPTKLGAQGITTPRTPSPGASVSQTIGISQVSINYSRPAVRDRDIWGALVPYGWNVQGFGLGNSAPWRSGANENTTITFSHDAKVEGKEVKAGTYGLFFVINEDNSGEVILSKDTRSWGSFFYNEAMDVMRAPIQVQDNDFTERLTYDFINLTKTTGDLVLNWEKKQFPVRIEFEVDAIVMNNASDQLKGTTGFSWQGFSTAANYALQNNTNLEQGLRWIDQAIARNKSFATLSVKSGILKAMGKEKESEEILADAFDTATEAELNVYGYQMANRGDMEEAQRVMKMNTDRHPESANAWDSLGEVHAMAGNNDEAIKYFKKSLNLNPPANVRANSEKYLKQLGAL